MTSVRSKKREVLIDGRMTQGRLAYSSGCDRKDCSESECIDCSWGASLHRSDRFVFLENLKIFSMRETDSSISRVTKVKYCSKGCHPVSEVGPKDTMSGLVLEESTMDV